MASATVSSLDGVLKAYYDDFKVKVMQYSESSFLAVLPRMTKFGGANLPIPIVYSTPAGRRSSVAAAQSAAAAAKTAHFVLTRASDYGVCSISNEALAAAGLGDKAAFVSARTTEIDGIFTSLTRSLSTAIHGTGSGSLGRVGSSTSTSITLSDSESVVNFDIGMELTASSADTTGARVGVSGPITSIDYDSGVLYCTTAGIASLSTNDYLQVSGDFNVKLKGLAGWIPGTAPTVGGGDSWFGVDRSNDPSKLAGIRVPSTVAPAGIALEEKVVRGIARVARQGGKPTTYLCSNAKFADLQSSLGARVHWSEVKTEDAEFGFETIKISSGPNTVEVLADPYCDNSTGWILQTDTWKLYSLGDVPRFENSDGLMMLRQSTSDGVEVRVKYYAQLGCIAPGKNGRQAI